MCPSLECQWRVPDRRWETSACPPQRRSPEVLRPDLARRPQEPWTGTSDGVQGPRTVSRGLDAFLVLPLPSCVTLAGCLPFLSLNKRGAVLGAALRRQPRGCWCCLAILGGVL